MDNFFRGFTLSWSAFLDLLPAILGAIICFILTVIIANFVSKLASKYSVRRTKDSLIANFISKIVWSVIFIMGTVLALGILGLGTISNKILAGAGITTFIVGFALKDIGENFLSGLILAFSRPYKVGNVIECDGVRGIVKDMTMRQTTVEGDNGKIILIPNSSIIKNPLIKYTNNDNNARQEFNISVNIIDAKKAIRVITDTINAFDVVVKNKENAVKIIIDSLSGDKAKLLVIFWYSFVDFKGSRSGSRSDIMLTVFEKLNEAGIKYSG